ncbi:type I 3-dehydroquinate dehydratase [Alkalicoccobacillus porphyridii]|uniref:3-dehydroquinate dehydratase n=1 Tax=Alkalicoccobacillus porphyridii TaxID=2597270 RepID=A0A553ZV86_9BACI|nr:type I 3-dehydroquinate dehydratase [Alkalicoccobacillus porphyridii]TSB45401.1 type I 3-dehydroquinate dehydratase [Alkalicoccobacillus porphyridii]
MSTAQEVRIRGVVMGREHRAAICCSLVGTTLNELLDELKVILPKRPDVLEWRVDFFSEIHNDQVVLDTAKKLREEIGEIVLLFTIRSYEEGGQPGSLGQTEQEQLLLKVLLDKSIDMLDIEQASAFASSTELVNVARSQQIKLIFSTHYFTHTPSANSMTNYLIAGQTAGADLVKLAVMPKNEEDVLSLLHVTNEAASTLTVPIITIAMGKLGVSTRLVGDQFGSTMTFAVGDTASAPGQVPVEMIRELQNYTKA